MRLSLVYKLIVPGLLVLYTGVMLGLHLGLLQKAVVVTEDSQNLIQQLPTQSSNEVEPVYRHESHFGVYNQKDRRPLNDLQSYRKVKHERQTLKLRESSHGGGTLETGSSTSVGNISVFSVYYDNRPTLKHGQPFMRIIALKRFNSVESLICHFNYGHNTWLKVHAHSYEMCENHGRYYGGWIFSCEIPQEILNNTVLETLTVISLSSTFHPEKLVKSKITAITFKESLEKPSSITIPSTKHSHLKFKSSKKQEFGLCLPPIFGDISLSLLIQFIELSKILGSSHLTFYIYDISDAVEKLLTFYEEEGEVTLVNWKLSPQINEREIWYHGQLLAIQDCLYRHMADFEYLLFVDLDEFLLPVYNHTWADMVHSLKNFESESNNVAGFSFKSAFFDPKQVPDPSQQLTFLQLLQRNKVLSSVRTKLMVAPQKIFELGIHHVSKTIHKDMRILEVDPGIAKIHHYRPCIINYEPDMKCYSEERDETILKYATNLVENYQTIIRETLDLFVPDR